MHGYTDSVDVPLHLPAHLVQLASSTKASSSSKAKGKEVAPPQSTQATVYSVTEAWTPEERAEMRRKVDMAALRQFPLLLLGSLFEE